MARPRSEDKRNAIIAAATRVIVARGLGAPTATIAQEAGVANGTLFTYFETKADLFNQLYLELKFGMATAALERLPSASSLREQMFHIWKNWTSWALAHPDQRRALAQLSVCDEITATSRLDGHRAMTGIIDLLERSRAGGSLRNLPMGFVGTLMNSMAEATMDSMVQNPERAVEYCKAGFDALWRALT